MSGAHVHYLSLMTCDRCRFWSDQIATATAEGHIHAMCLNPASVEYKEYTAAGDDCEMQEPGTPIDE